jgi:hypothetical protein
MVAAHALLALAPVLGLAAYCLSHLVACRLVRNRGNYFPLVLGCGCGLTVAVAISLAGLLWMRTTLADGLALAAVNVAAYLALGFGYFNFINLNIASLRIRMIQELAASGSRLPIMRLTGLYNTETVAELRIDRLTRGGHLVERDGRFYSGKRRFLIVARIFDFLRWAILGNRVRGPEFVGWDKRVPRAPAHQTNDSVGHHSQARLSHPTRPLRLLAEPVRLAGELGEQLSFAGRRQRIVRRIGPERIETGWWRGGARGTHAVGRQRVGVARDYYRVKTADGCWYWLFRRLPDGPWFLHGTFD